MTGPPADEYPWDTVIADARRLGLPLTTAHVLRFASFASLLARGRTQLNLTAIREPHQVAIKLFLDSVTVLLGVVDPLPDHPRVLDLGTGAGFPGVPVAILLPHAGVTLLDATGRKIAWLEEVVRVLELGNAYPITGRAEELGHHQGWRGQFDLVIVRAVASLATLAELALPFVRVGGQVIAMKSQAGVIEELHRAERAAWIVGGEVVAVTSVPSDLIPNRALVTFRRSGPTPSAYPRRSGLPAHEPLGDEPV